MTDDQEIRIYRDGDQWCARRGTDLQEGESGGVPPERRGPAPRYPQLLDETWLRTQIEREFLTAEQVAESLGCSSNTVYRAMRRYGIRTIPKGVRCALRARLIQQRAEESV